VAVFYLTFHLNFSSIQPIKLSNGIIVDRAVQTPVVDLNYNPRVSLVLNGRVRKRRCRCSSRYYRQLDLYLQSVEFHTALPHHQRHRSASFYPGPILSSLSLNRTANQYAPSIPRLVTPFSLQSFLFNASYRRSCWCSRTTIS
jgi:hypothetical protein